MISEKFNLYYFRLLGGEPLLHPNIAELIKTAREILKKTILVLVTNGLLIPRLDDQTLQTFADNDIIISISLYEPTNKVLDEIKKKLNKFGIKYIINDNYYDKPEVINYFQTRLSMEKSLDGQNVSEICNGRFCRFLRDGKITKCYYPLLIDILNKKYNLDFQLDDNDYIDLKEIKDGWMAIEQLNSQIPFCDYCSKELKVFRWHGHCKNDKNVKSFVIKKKMI